MQSKSLLITTLIQVVAWVLVHAIFKNEKWYEFKLQDVITILLIAALTFLVGAFTIFYRPLFLKVSQNNSIGEQEDKTIIDIQNNRCRVLQNQRTICLNVSLERRTSFWWLILKRIIANYEVYLNVRLNRPSLAIKEDKLYTAITPNTSQGFNLDLKQHIQDVYLGNSQYEIQEQYKYFIIYDGTMHNVMDSQYYIDPILTVNPINPKWYSKIITILFNWILRNEIQNHCVKIYKR